MSIAAFRVVARARHMERFRGRVGAWVELLTFVRDRISCFATPLPELLAEAPPRLVARLFDGGAARDFAVLCRASAETLEGESAHLLRHLADEIGTIWRQEQIDRLNFYIGALEKEKNAMDAALPKRLRVEGTLTLCGTLALLLLIW